jgi:ribonuclease HI
MFRAPVRFEKELYDAEVALTDPDVRSSRSLLEELLHDDFSETGSSGEVYDRDTMIDMMTSEAPGLVVIRDFTASRLSESVAIANYRSIGVSGQEVKRTSVWIELDGVWRLRHHQGTRVADLWGAVS